MQNASKVAKLALEAFISGLDFLITTRIRPPN